MGIQVRPLLATTKSAYILHPTPLSPQKRVRKTFSASFVASASRKLHFGPLVKKKCVGPYSSEKSINGPHDSDKVIAGRSHASDKAIRDPMQCNDKTSVVDYY